MNACLQQNRTRSLLVGILVSVWMLCPGISNGVTPAPDGGYPGDNTAEGQDALFSLTGGVDNTALGFNALYNTTGGNYNTATGSLALYSNNLGYSNTADGAFSLQSNSSGSSNTAVGSNALNANTISNFNTAVGTGALEDSDADSNTAVGVAALSLNTSGCCNTAIGIDTLYANSTGVSNTAIGYSALSGNMTGSLNVAVGYLAGSSVSTGSNNIEIGNTGASNDSGVIRIGTKGTQRKTFIAGIYNATASGGVAVYVNSNGQLGTLTSSARFKEEVRDMSDASDVLLSLRPVAFRYKADIDPQSVPQFGLIAEEVQKVDPDLVVRDADGKPYTVRYDAVNAMLLNEFLKEHRKVEEQGKTIAELRSTITQQAKGMEALAARVQEQSRQIQRVSAELAATKPAPQVAENR
jgi:hypothetical protein